MAFRTERELASGGKIDAGGIAKRLKYALQRLRAAASPRQFV